MFKPENRAHFRAVVADLLDDPEVLAMADIHKHGKKGNCLDHSLYVAYLSFLFCRRFGLDYVAAARAGLLHDFYLYDYKQAEEMGRVAHVLHHPKVALENAQSRYTLSSKECDIIEKHMWPLTPALPRHKESFVVSMADKLAASMELCRLYKAFKVQKKLAEQPVAA